MKTKKLTAIIISTIGLIGLASCNPNRKYQFKGELGHEKVEFVSHHFPRINGLRVTKPDGRFIEYIDNANNDLKLEFIAITKDGETNKYTPKKHKPVMEKAQRQFDQYLREILEYKQIKGRNEYEDTIQKGLEDLD